MKADLPALLGSNGIPLSRVGQPIYDHKWQLLSVITACVPDKHS
jgi:hypothetical protein